MEPLRKYDPDKHRRRSIRPKGFDYRQPGAYFVTICTQNRACFLGAVAGGEMQSTNAGEIAKATWNELPARFPSLGLDAFVIMPNHIHGIIMVGAQFIAPSDGFGETNMGAINHAPTLGEIVHTYKAASTRLIKQAGTPNFAWQRNYYEHIVRDEESSNRIRQYIHDNPARWEFDRENPAAKNPEPENAWRA